MKEAYRKIFKNEDSATGVTLEDTLDMVDFRRVALEDFEFLQSVYHRSMTELAYNSFTGTFSTTQSYGTPLYYAILEKDIVVYVTRKSEDLVITPLHLGRNSVSEGRIFQEFCIKHNIRTGEYIDRKYVDSLSPFFNLKQADEKDHEAIYPIERFREFEGVKNQKRRANMFFRNNSYEFVEYAQKNKEDVINLAIRWEENSSHPTGESDVDLAKLFTENYGDLPIRGYLLYVKSQLEGILFGEKVNHDTFIFNLVKAGREVVGTYQALYQLVTRHPDLKDIRYINNTNLTCVAGLKESKLRLKPSKLVIPWEFKE